MSTTLIVIFVAIAFVAGMAAMLYSDKAIDYFIGDADDEDEMP